MGRGQGKEGQERGKKGKGMKNAIKLYYMYAPSPHKKCKYYILQTNTNLRNESICVSIDKSVIRLSCNVVRYLYILQSL